MSSEDESLFTPVVIPDLGEAGSVWRSTKLQDFERKIQILGLEGDPECAALRNLIVSYTTELEDLWKRQQESDSERKWWHDGEYDADRADRCNDDGMIAYKNKCYGDAFECFTEAIRLHPTSPVYHSNRSLVGLKLGRHDVALEDAKHSIEQDSSYVNGYVRAGKACLGLCLAEDGKQYFSMALERSPDCIAARRGLKECIELIARLEREDIENQTLADSCSRPALPLEGEVHIESVSEALLGEESMLSCNPRLESAMYHKAECLVLIGRFPQALEYIRSLRDGMERRYLETEALWRSGAVEDAEERLKHLPKNIQKCLHLEHVVRRHARILRTIEDALEDHCNSEAVTLCTEALDALPVTLASGLYCRLLRHRASGYCRMSRWEEAMNDLDLNLSLNQEDIEAMRCKADVLKERGLFTEYFLSLRALQQKAPGLPGIVDLIQEAASLSLEHGSQCESRNSHENVASGPKTAFDILGVVRGSSVFEVRQAYLKLAAKWHPDKWASKGEKAIKAAEEKFKDIQKSYDDICGDTRW